MSEWYVVRWGGGGGGGGGGGLGVRGVRVGAKFIGCMGEWGMDGEGEVCTGFRGSWISNAFTVPN